MSAPHSQTLPPESAAGAAAVPAGTARLSALRPRLSPKARRPTGSTPGHASWDADPAGVTRLRLSQSRESTSRIGRSTGVSDARSRPGAGLQIPPAGTALAPSFGCRRRRPFDERDSANRTGNRDQCQENVAEGRTRPQRLKCHFLSVTRREPVSASSAACRSLRSRRSFAPTA
jgi:hypothetical protein